MTTPVPHFIIVFITFASTYPTAAASKLENFDITKAMAANSIDILPETDKEEEVLEDELWVKKIQKFIRQVKGQPSGDLTATGKMQVVSMHLIPIKFHNYSLSFFHFQRYQKHFRKWHYKCSLVLLIISLDKACKTWKKHLWFSCQAISQKQIKCRIPA